MNTEQIKDIQTQLALIEAEMGRIRVIMREASQQSEGSSSELPNNYTHLLPKGCEFCAEEDAVKCVKVEMLPEPRFNLHKVGHVMNRISELAESYMNTHYRPIRPIQYHVAVHEAVTVEPNPYAVDWTNAPDKADSHAFDKDGTGWFYGLSLHAKFWYADNVGRSGHTLPDGLDWKLSKTFRPR